MSEASTDRADRPAEVSDPLLWGLAAAVADAHQPDDERVCVSPSCVGAAWPCAAWNSAQEGLRAARAPLPAPSPTGWSSDLVPAAPVEAAARPAGDEQLAVTSAA
ncbi:hypothetical protein Q2K19_28430 [Micromonospora soli]|uniref:hypothetical protein n=1 Tax=Micromonospora sp. NBRC 110009 TaxID=3061627 RepID=UPI002671DED3|nr:hypothetical protein [Micromonospora sp. NBRC 110009]WKT98052.1 hypothetical protein Q2K19_28430 [Micromonospora sp. NBRC 110009]